jgi:hypothetical protein
MYWKKLIIAITVLLTACSPVRYTGLYDTEVNNGSFIDLNKTISMNMSGSDYNILKAVVKISAEEEENEFLVNIKYKKPDNYLISVKSKTGIEAARIFVSEDTVLMNDRINKRLYYGSSKYLDEKYGVNVKNIQLLLGDFLTGDNESLDTLKCFNGVALVSDIINGKRIDYRVDCSSGKVTDTYINAGIDNDLLHLRFDKLIAMENIIIPGLITLANEKNNLEIKMEMEKVVCGPVYEMVFIAGKGYEMVLLK